MKVVAVVTDLMIYSRIESAARIAGVELARVDDPHAIPPDAELILVDWSARRDGWGAGLGARSGRVILFGPHTDLEAHAASRRIGLGPMWARSKLLAELPVLLRTPSVGET
jgi:hypothetical protein